MRHSIRAFLIMLLSMGGQAGAEPGKALNPLVYGDHTELRKLGVEVSDFGPTGGRDLPEKCGAYIGGDGFYNFSYSKDFAKRFRDRGFTNLSLCMAMGSEIKYDPETGRRLPTFILADIDALRKGLNEAGTATEQIPYDLPNCFKNAQPLSDCELNFDMNTGRKLTSRAALALRKAGIDGSAPVVTKLKSNLLPKGMGYVLYNDGAAGPEASNATIRIVLRPVDK